MTAYGTASDIAISLAPANASVGLGATQTFHATLTSPGHPDPSLLWKLSGAACPNACGAVDQAGNYTAPVTVPAGTAVTITATMTPVPGSDPSAVLFWTLSGPGCTGVACGKPGITTRTCPGP